MDKKINKIWTRKLIRYGQGNSERQGKVIEGFWAKNWMSNWETKKVRNKKKVF